MFARSWWIPLVLLAGCQSPYYADQGALLGGLAGAATGAAIGDRGGHAAGGAIIGGAAGALTGAAVGGAIDADLARSQAVIRDRLGHELRGAVTPQDVVAMNQAGVPEGVILTHVRANGLARPLSTGDVIALTRQGVGEQVILAMQETQTEPVSVAPTAFVPAAPRPAFVIEHYAHPPPPRWARRRFPPPHCHW